MTNFDHSDVFRLTNTINAKPTKSWHHTWAQGHMSLKFNGLSKTPWDCQIVLTSQLFSFMSSLYKSMGLNRPDFLKCDYHPISLTFSITTWITFKGVNDFQFPRFLRLLISKLGHSFLSRICDGFWPLGVYKAEVTVYPYLKIR